jgi:hypothetical protein
VKNWYFLSIPRTKRQQTRVEKNRKRAEFNPTELILVRWKLIQGNGMVLNSPHDTARKAGSDGRIQVYIGCGHPIQTWARATE